MKNRYLFSVFHLFVFCVGLCTCKGEKTFVVKEGCYVPLFGTDALNLSYEAGAHGTNCYHLITVLLPGTFVDVPDFGEKVSKVVWHVNEKKTYEGYVHNDFLEKFCREIPKDAVKCSPSPMPLEEIRTLFQCCIDEQVPYCWGGNCLEAVPLPKDYVFSQNGGKVKKPYELRGFDCSGLLYFISGGLLQHSTRRLRECEGGKILWTVGKKDVVSLEDLKKELGELKLQDTDYIVLIGHVVVWFNGGIIEFRGMDYGCVFTSGEEAVAGRIMELIEKSRTNEEEDNDVRFVRWHPELSEE